MSPLGRYRPGSGAFEDYLEPDQGNLGSIASGAAMLAMMYTPLGGKLFSGVFKGLKAAGKGVAAAAPKISKFAVNKVAPRAFGATVSAAEGAGRAIKYLGRPVNWMSKHRAATIGIGVGVAALAGAKGGFTATPVSRETPTQTMSFDKSMRGGLAPNNLGATGDLTLALHNRR